MKRKKIIGYIVLFVFVCGVLIGVKLIFFPDETKRIRRTISDVVSDLEKKQVNAFMRHFAFDYRDGFDNTYGTLYILLKNNINRCGSIDIDINQMEIEIEESNAIVRFFAAAAVKTTDGEIYKEAGRFILKLRKGDLTWHIYRFDEMDYEFDYEFY